MNAEQKLDPTRYYKKSAASHQVQVQAPNFITGAATSEGGVKHF